MDKDNESAPRHLTPEELRERNKKVMHRLRDHRLALAWVAFVSTLVTKRQVRAALKEARHAWRLEIFEKQGR